MVRILELCTPYCTLRTENVCKVRYGVRNFGKRRVQFRWRGARRAQEPCAHFSPASLRGWAAAAAAAACGERPRPREGAATDSFLKTESGRPGPFLESNVCGGGRTTAAGRPRQGGHERGRGRVHDDQGV